MKRLRLVLAQTNFLLGAIENNTEHLLRLAQKARDEWAAHLIVFPELTLTGYPMEDLLFYPDCADRVGKAFNLIQQQLPDITAVIGHPHYQNGGCYNAASIVLHHELLATYHKQHLPNYSVFDEKRYFKPGAPQATVFDCQGLPIAIIICEDLWENDPIQQAKQAGAQLILCLNASPFDRHKPQARIDTLMQAAQKHQLPIAYVQWVAGQDELVFDGGSLIVNHQGVIVQQAPYYEEYLLPIDITYDSGKNIHIDQGPLPPALSEEERIYKALVLGTRDYVNKNGFRSALIGLSGGIDSALTTAIAVDALGAHRVETVMMPSRYTSPISQEDAAHIAQNLNVKHAAISIEPTYQAFLQSLATPFCGLLPDTTEENLQARCRGTILMALANKTKQIVLTTGNKSELAMGYATLYGDMAGGFAVLKDVPKTLVYALACYRNHQQTIIPERVFSRAPTAELAPNQKDENTLPPYTLLDQILELYIDKNLGIEEIITKGFDRKTVLHIVKTVDAFEYKRRQAPPGVRISARAFGRDRRYPMTSGFWSTRLPPEYQR